MDKESLSKSLHTLPWRLRAQSIFDLLGYGEISALNADSFCAKNSQAYLMGCRSLSDLCELLTLSSEEITQETRALHLSSKLGVSGESPSDVITNYDQVVDILGRHPVSASEVSESINFVKDAKIADLDKANATLEEKVVASEKRIHHLEQELTSREGRLTQLRSELESRIESLHQESSQLKEQHAQKIHELEDAHQARLEYARDEVRSLLQSEFNESLETARQEHQQQIESLNEDKQSAIARLESVIDNEMVTLEAFDRVNLENEQVRQLNRDNLLKIKELTKKIESLSDGDALQQEIEHLNQKLKKLTKAYRVVESKRSAFEEKVKALEEEHRQELEEAIAQAQQETQEGPSGKGLPVVVVSVVSALGMVAGYYFFF